MAVAPRTVNVFGSDQESQPLAVFDTPVTVKQIREVLGLAKGGLKRKGGPDIYTNNLNAGGDFTFIGGPKFVVTVNFLGTTAKLNIKSPKSKVRALIDEISAYFSSTHLAASASLLTRHLQLSSAAIPMRPRSPSCAVAASS